MSGFSRNNPGQEERNVHRAWTVFIGRVGGIPIYLHFTFILMLAYVTTAQLSSGEKIFGGIFFVLGVFGSVVLHELGHAMMAKYYGIKTQDIVLYPIGGVARLRSLGEGWQEFWIALAGPAVNLLIVAVIVIALHFTGNWLSLEQIADLERQTEAAGGDEVALKMPFMYQLASLNLILMLFNLVPAFPMDGGRILRAVLSNWLPRPRATAIAAKIGQAFAVLFMLVGLVVKGNIILVVIGVFIFIAAGQEAMSTRSISLLAGHTVRDAMITRFETLNHGDSLGKAADLLLETDQHDFPVFGGVSVIGLLARKDLINGLMTLGRDHYVAEVMQREFPRLSPEMPLQAGLDALRLTQGMPVMVFDGDELVGYINQENLSEYLMIAQARARAAAPESAG